MSFKLFSMARFTRQVFQSLTCFRFEVRAGSLNDFGIQHLPQHFSSKQVFKFNLYNPQGCFLVDCGAE